MEYIESFGVFLIPVIILVVMGVFVLKTKQINNKKGNMHNTFLFMLIFSTIIITFPLVTVFKINIIYVIFAFVFNVVVNYTAFKQLVKKSNM